MPNYYADEIVAFMRKHETMPRKELTTLINSEFGANFSLASVKSKCFKLGLRTGRCGRFETGASAWNAGTKGVMKPNASSFKKGSVPKNMKPIGYEYVNTQGYVYVKIADPDKFILKHKLVWEKANGKVPRGFVITFKNADKQDCRLGNLELVSRAVMARMNQSFSHLSTSETNESCILLAKIKDKTHSLKRKKL